MANPRTQAQPLQSARGGPRSSITDKARRQDPALSLIERILAEPIPKEGADGRIAHPGKRSSARKQGERVTLTDIVRVRTEHEKFPSDVTRWTLKTFSDYFGDQYQATTNRNYRITYQSDNQVFQQIGNFLASNGLPRNEWVRRMIDWSMTHYAEILRREGMLTPQVLLRLLNQFYQQEVMTRVEEGTLDRGGAGVAARDGQSVQEVEDVSLLAEICNADESGATTEIFASFGIPVAFTYLLQMRKFRHESLVPLFVQQWPLFTEEQRQRTIERSILGSPYPEQFDLLDWRERFSALVDKYRSQTWWRDVDYRGSVLPKYGPFLPSEPKTVTGS